MKGLRKVMLTLLVVGGVASLAGFGVFSAFSSTTTNPGNSFAAGSVNIADNDAGTALYNVTNKKPGDTATGCIKVTYTGSLPATVKLYRSAFAGGSGLDTYLDVNVTRGTGTNADCGDFTAAASGSSVYTGTLNAFNTSFASGISLSNGAGAGAWGQNDAVTYKFTVSLQDNNSANGLTSGVHSFVWEAHNN